MRAVMDLTVVFVMALGFAPEARAQDDPKDLQGEYEIVSGQHDGEAVPAEHVKGARVRITADTIVTTDAQGKDLYVARYTLETLKSPWSIAMTATGGPEEVKVGTKAYGVIKREGDTLSLCYAPEGHTPAVDFRSVAGSGHNLFVMKRIGK